MPGQGVLKHARFYEGTTAEGLVRSAAKIVTIKFLLFTSIRNVM